MESIVLATGEILDERPTDTIPALSAQAFTATPTGLVVSRESVDYEIWAEYGRGLQRVQKAIHFVLGDWLNYGDRAYGEKYTQALENTPFEYQTLADDKWVTEQLEFSRRRENLSFAHHREVAPLDPDEQDHWLDAAEENTWTCKELRDAIRRARLPAGVKQLGTFPVKVIEGDMLEELPGLGPFDCVVTDPPYNVTAFEWDQFGSPQGFLDEVETWLAAMRAVLSPEFHLFWFCSPRYAADIELLFRRYELPIVSRIVWNRRSMPKGSHAKNKFIDTWEMILHAGNRPMNFPTEWTDAWFDVQTFATPLTSYKGIDRRVHETQKPSELIRRLVEFGSFPGDKVLDPFAGSGTLGLVCPADRECTLIEKDANYARAIRIRLGIEPAK